MRLTCERIAEDILLWKKSYLFHDSMDYYVWEDSFGKLRETQMTWHPQQHVGQAWLVWEALRQSGKYCCMTIEAPLHEDWSVTMKREGFDEDHTGADFVYLRGVNIARLICDACLLAEEKYDLAPLREGNKN